MTQRSLLGLALMVAACGGGLPHPNAQHVALAREADPQASLTDLERGRSLYQAKCGSCHALREPESVPAANWQHEVEQMRDKQNVRVKPDEVRDMVRYLSAVTQDVPQVVRCATNYCNPDLPETTRFRETRGEVEGVYSDGRRTVKFLVDTTANTPGQHAAVVAALNDWLEQRR